MKQSTTVFMVFFICLLFLGKPAIAGEFNSLDIIANAESRMQAWQQLIENNKDDSDWQKLNKVNRFFNQVNYIDDKTQWNVDDYWATPVEFLTRNAGDCEDYSIAKYFTLKAMGVPVQRMRITYVLLLPEQQAHMVLVYFEGESNTPLVLDNLTASITAFSQRLELDPVYSFNDKGLWLANRFANQSQFVGGNEQVGLWKSLSEKILKENVL